MLSYTTLNLGDKMTKLKKPTYSAEFKLLAANYKCGGNERLDISNHLNREFAVVAANEAWCGGLIYIWQLNSWCYLAVVMDLFSRKIIGWAMSQSPDQH